MSTSETTRPIANAMGEVKGFGPAYACDKYGTYGHNNLTCIDCVSNFMTQYDDHRSGSRI